MIKSLLTGLFCLGLAQPLLAVDPTIYGNDVNDLLIRFDTRTNQVGDQIVLAGTQRYLTRFDFEYFGTNTANPSAFAGSVTADVKIYLNDGPLFNGYATPGTVLWDSGSFGGFGTTPRSTLVFTVAGGDFPSTGLFLSSSTLTWAVQFSGMGATDSVGLDLYSPPVVGGNYPDYWQNSGGGWQLLTNSIGPMSFGARMFASANPVPEPSMEAFTVLGALFSLGAARWKIRAKK